MSKLLEDLLANPVTLVSVVISATCVLGGLVAANFYPKLFLLVLKNLRRNVVRTVLTCLATMVLVFMVTMIWTVIYFLDQVTREKTRDFKLIITERWQLPSMMPPTHASYLDPESPNCIYNPAELGIGPEDFMTWSFYGGTIDPTKFTREGLVFFFVMQPKHIRPMMEDLDKLDPELIEKMESNPIGCLLGKERMQNINKKVGERFKLTSLNYKGVDLEFEIVGELPEGRYNQSGIMNASYFNKELDNYARVNRAKHPLDNKRLNLVWIRVRDMATFNQLGDLIEN